MLFRAEYRKTVADLRRSYRRYGIRCSTNVSVRAVARTDGQSRQRRPFFRFFVHLSMKGTGNALHVTHGKTVTATPLIDRMLPGGSPPSSLRGRVIDRLTRRPSPMRPSYSTDRGDKGASDRLRRDASPSNASARHLPAGGLPIGYRNTLTPEYVVSAATPFIEIELVEDAAQLDAVTVTPTPFRRTAESPVGLQVIGLREIERARAPTATFLASCAPIPAYRSRPSVTATT